MLSGTTTRKIFPLCGCLSTPLFVGHGTTDFKRSYQTAPEHKGQRAAWGITQPGTTISDTSTHNKMMKLLFLLLLISLVRIGRNEQKTYPENHLNLE